MIPPFGRYCTNQHLWFSQPYPTHQPKMEDAKNNDFNPKVVGIMATVLAFGALHLGETKKTDGKPPKSEI